MLRLIVGFAALAGVGQPLDAQMVEATPAEALRLNTMLIELSPHWRFDEDVSLPSRLIGPDGELHPGRSVAEGLARDEREADAATSLARATIVEDSNGDYYSVLAYTLYAAVDVNQLGARLAVELAGHRHDVETVVVWIRGRPTDQDERSVVGVSFSQHGAYLHVDGDELKRALSPDGVPLSSYHRRWWSTAELRPASADEAGFRRLEVVDVELLEPRLQKKLAAANLGAAVFPLLGDDRFAKLLDRSRPPGVTLRGRDSAPPPKPPGHSLIDLQRFVDSLAAPKK